MGIKQYNNAIQRSYGPTGCRFHPNCLDCPLPKCVEDMSQSEVQRLHNEKTITDRNRMLLNRMDTLTGQGIPRHKAIQIIAQYMGLKGTASIYRRLKRIKELPQDLSSQREIYLNEGSDEPTPYRYRMLCPHCTQRVTHPISDADTRYYLNRLMSKSLSDAIVRHGHHQGCGKEVWLIFSVSEDLRLTAGLAASPWGYDRLEYPEPYADLEIRVE